MKRIFAPWRSNHAKEIAKNKKDPNNIPECVFCPQFEESKNNIEISEKNFILRRFTYSIAILNKFPYNSGHILILPIKHVATLSELTIEERSELMELSCKTSEVLSKCLQNHGLNIGINIGKASGASVPTHLHIHVLPRFNGDTNFMPVLADTKIISFSLDEIYKKLKPEFENITI